MSNYKSLGPARQSQISLLREWIATVGLSIVLLSGLSFIDLTRPLSDLVYDHWLRWHGFESTSDIVLVTIDERTLQQLGRWPLPRDYYTQFLKRLQDTGAQPKAIGFDLLLIQRTPEDAKLAQAIREQSVVLPVEFLIDGTAKNRLQVVNPSSVLSDAGYPAHINLSFDPDGVIRGFDTQVNGIAQMSILMHRIGDSNRDDFLSQDEHLRFEMVNPMVGFPKISLVDAINEHYPTSIFNNKYIFIGVTAPDLGDRYATIYSGENNISTPGVEILASILKSSLEDRLIRTADNKTIFLVNLSILSIVLISLLKLPPKWGLFLDGFLILGVLSASYVLLTTKHLWITPVPIIFLILLLKPIWTWRRLEAILSLVVLNVRELEHNEDLAGKASLFSPRDVVIRYGQILESAVNVARIQIEFLDAVIRTMPSGIYIFDESGNVLLKNNAALALLEPDHPVMHQTELVTRLGLSQTLISGKVEISLQSPLLCRLPTPIGDKEFYLSIDRIASIGGVVLSVAIFTDVTDLRKSQNQRDRTLQFLSHDMRTPVSSIIAVTQLIENSEVAKVKINQHARHLLQMMEDFILTIKLETMSENFESLLLDHIIDDVHEKIADLAYRRKVSLVFMSDDIGIFIKGDVRLLVRMFVNLLSNAVKYGKEGTNVTVSWQAVRGPSHSSVDDKVVIEISNFVENPEYSESLHFLGESFGLGLLFVDTVVKRHQGNIERNIPVQGMALVQITLPCTIHNIE